MLRSPVLPNPVTMLRPAVPDLERHDDNLETKIQYGRYKEVHFPATIIASLIAYTSLTLWTEHFADLSINVG